MLCDGCGKETTNIRGLCPGCRGCNDAGYIQSTAEYKDRKINNPQTSSYMGLTDMKARADEEGWPYDDNDY